MWVVSRLGVGRLVLELSPCDARDLLASRQHHQVTPGVGADEVRELPPYTGHVTHRLLPRCLQLCDDAMGVVFAWRTRLA